MLNGRGGVELSTPPFHSLYAGWYNDYKESTPRILSLPWPLEDTKYGVDQIVSVEYEGIEKVLHLFNTCIEMLTLESVLLSGFNSL